MNTVLRTAIMRIMSEMLDNPDEHGIYPTGKFMDRIESLLESMMVAPEVMQLSGSEALYGFVNWLITSDESLIAEAKYDVALWAELVKEFCIINDLTEPREMWDTLCAHPGSKAA